MPDRPALGCELDCAEVGKGEGARLDRVRWGGNGDLPSKKGMNMKGEVKFANPGAIKLGNDLLAIAMDMYWSRMLCCRKKRSD